MKQNPFAPSTTAHSSTSPKDSSKDVTVPDLPELHDPMYLNKLLPAKPIVAPPVEKSTAEPPKQGTAFMAALNKVENRQYTQNMAHAFASTLSPTFDAFNGLSQATNRKDFEPLLRKSWDADPLLTVKIIFNLRSIHEGKSEREGFYRAWGWLYRNHPRTAIANLSVLVEPLIEQKLKDKKNKDGGPAGESDDDVVLIDADGEDAEKEKNVRGISHGYWKDLLNLLSLAAKGELDSGTADFEALHPPRTPRSTRRKPVRHQQKYQGRKQSVTKRETKDEGTGDARIAEANNRDGELAAKAKDARDKAHEQSRNRILKLFETSKPFKALYITVARLFAQGLEADIGLLEKIASPNMSDKERVDLSFQISLCSKYAPSISASHDRATNIASAIAELLWIEGKLHMPYEQTQNLSIDKVHDLRRAYTRWILSPLRRFLQIPEIYMASNRWGELPYGKVASKCMQNNKGLFFKHDEGRFSKYLKDVASGKRTISGGTLLPHSLLKEALAVKSVHKKDVDPAAHAEIQVIEAQWKTMIEKLRESGNLDNCMAVCDVSGSMGSLSSQAHGDQVRPILPAVALSLVLSQVSREPWANSFITFSARPQIVKLDPTAGLVETATTMNRADWDMNTDFNAVFTKLILPMAIEHKVPKEEMIKRLFVFSDMEFDQTHEAGMGQWTTEHEKIVKAFEKAGYDLPEIVYWNLQGARGAKPVKADWEGVALMSGFSSNMLKTFMDNGEVREEEIVEEDVELEDGIVILKKTKQKKTPEDIMKKALNRPSYATLVVVD